MPSARLPAYSTSPGVTSLTDSLESSELFLTRDRRIDVK